MSFLPTHDPPHTQHNSTHIHIFMAEEEETDAPEPPLVQWLGLLGCQTLYRRRRRQCSGEGYVGSGAQMAGPGKKQLDAVPDSVYEKLEALWLRLPPEMRELAQHYPCRDYLDPPHNTQPCREKIYMISGSSLCSLVPGVSKLLDVNKGLEDKFSVWREGKAQSMREREGDELEPPALALYLKQEQRRTAAVYKVSMEDCKTFICPSFPLLCSEPDGLMTYNPATPSAAATPPAPRYTKLVEVKTLSRSRRLEDLKKPPPHVVLQAAMHMLCTRVPVVDVCYFSQSGSGSPQTKVFPMRWDPELQQRLIDRDIPTAVVNYRRVWLPKFLDHRARVRGGKGLPPPFPGRQQQQGQVLLRG